MNLATYTNMNFKDSEIMGLYDKMVSEGTSDIVFYDGIIKNREMFLSEMKSNRCKLHILFDKEPIAIVYLNMFEGRTARFHFCAFSKIWGGEAIKAGRFICGEILNYKYEEDYIFDALTGRIPVSNKKAVEYLKKMGAVIAGKIPLGIWNERNKKSEDCFIVCMNREVLDGWK